MMRRQTYDALIHKPYEEAIISALASSGYSVVPLGFYSPGDFFLRTLNGRTYLVEYKKRNIDFGLYGTAIMPETKLRRCLCLAEDLGISFLYMVEHPNGVYVAEVDDYYVTTGGRTDRADPADIYKMAHIDCNQFRRLNI